MAIKVTKIKKSRIKNTNNKNTNNNVKKGKKNAKTRRVAKRKK